jgi:multiple sugar transport system permease protein
VSARYLRQPLGLKFVSALGLAVWTLVAIFPLLWIATMSFRMPLDAFSSNPVQVLIGPHTKETNGGPSMIGVLVGGLALWLTYAAGRALLRSRRREGARRPWTMWLLAGLGFGAVVIILFGLLLPSAVQTVEAALAGIPMLGALANPLVGITTQHYRSVWIDHAFYRQFLNSMLVTGGVVLVSVTVGTLAGYALARTRTQLAFWILMIALIFRAMPHSVLVAGYLPVIVNSREMLAPLWDSTLTGPFLRLFSAQAPTLYGQPLAVIAVLVAINQPFTIWMLRSFFANIPAELDEAARVDGCSQLEAFWRVIIPVMWPGVITTGLFSFLLAYNDYLVTALLLDAQSLTMVPMISQYLASETNATEQLHAIAAAVSITAPLFLLVLVFQRHLVGGLTQGAVKG